MSNDPKPAGRPIRVLPADLSSKIAAGEVIERPASVVKELVENSLDAGALDIAVEIAGGGLESIRVADNGVGIPSAEVELAFQRFATSKVASLDDLEAVSTLGFRGEALPSISAVASVSMVTRSVGEEFGTRIDLEEGRVVRKEPHGAAPGTVVTARHLFRSFPARRKFLRSPATELSRVQAVLVRCALAYPEVRFHLVVDGSSTFSSTGSGDLREVAAAVYGLEVAESMLELPQGAAPAQGSGASVWGLVSPPSVHRANRSYVSFFVNRRWVQSPMLGKALEQAYHGFLMERRYPLAAINLIVPHGELDVNVHPAKSEVRFRSEGQVFAALQQAVRGALTQEAPVPQFAGPLASRTHHGPRSQSPPFWPGRPATEGAPAPAQHGAHPPAAIAFDSPLTPKRALPVLRPLGQVQNTYIAAEGPDGMYLIDQHAAHERVLFEQVRAETGEATRTIQMLLEPASVEVDAPRRELLESQAALIQRIGFQFEGFGGATYLVRSVPALLGEADPRQAFLDVLDMMAQGGGFESWEERAAYSIACHAAVRAGKPLTREEMAELTRRLEECEQPHTCPHGRPTMVHLSAGRLEREFGRR